MDSDVVSKAKGTFIPRDQVKKKKKKKNKDKKTANMAQMMQMMNPQMMMQMQKMMQASGMNMSNMQNMAQMMPQMQANMVSTPAYFLRIFYSFWQYLKLGLQCIVPNTFVRKSTVVRQKRGLSTIFG